VIKEATTTLLVKIKASLTQIFGILITFLTPIKPLIIIVGVAIALDTFYGVRRAKKTGEKVTSRKLSKIISKMVLYQTAVILFFCVEKFILGDIIGLFTSIPLILTKVVTTVLLYIEATSISESYEIMYGVSLWKKFKELIRRTGETKQEIQEILKKES
jgi:hypothetical protein